MNEGKNTYIAILWSAVLLYVWVDNSIYNLHLRHIWQHIEWIFFSFLLIQSQFLTINFDHWNKQCLWNSPTFISGCISLHNVVFTCLLPIKKLDFHRPCIVLILLLFSVMTLSEKLEPFSTSLPPMNRLILVNTGENTSYYAEIRTLLSVEQPKWCRARAPLVAKSKIFIFYTCLPSILAHVSYHTHTYFFSTQLCSFFPQQLI